MFARMPLRDYQIGAVCDIHDKWRSCRSVLLCAPTGSGKTETASAAVTGFDSVLWLNGRKDLLEQTKNRLAIHSNITVASVLSSKLPQVQAVVFDEAHHSACKSWQETLVRFPDAKILGATASPQRADGRALDMFDALVVAANYSELIAAGHLVPCRVFEPRVFVDRGIALSPTEAYLRHTPGKKAFCYVPNLKYAGRVQEEFAKAGVRSAVLHGGSKKDERYSLLAQLESGEIKVLINCMVLIEGIDCPSVEVCILARRCQHYGLFLQACGRVLRPFPGKQFGIILDLVGAVRRLGLPTDDREYSLIGSGIAKSSLPSLRSCYVCGAVMHSTERSCVTCGMVFVPGVHRPPKILHVDLRERYAGSETPEDSKFQEFLRVAAGDMRPWPKVKKHYEELFGESPPQSYWASIVPAVVRKEWTRVYFSLKNKLGTWKAADAASQIIKSYTGAFPPWDLRKGIQ